ncbi:MAG: hypothetical protein QOD39_1691 [Mycobacterium sp.]|nr:hypothetical protein [Mycobacterium sp.]
MRSVHPDRMTIDQPTSSDLPWGASDPTAQRWGLRETMVAVGVAAVIACLGGAAVYAATDSGTHTSSAPFGHGVPGAMLGGPPPGGITGPNPATPPALHGEFVVRNGADYATELTQMGTVTAMSPTSITVRSDDGYTQTYALPPGADANQSIVASDEVSVRATRSGQTAVVSAVSRQSSPGPGAALHAN